MSEPSHTLYRVRSEIEHVGKVLGVATLAVLALTYDVMLVQTMLGYQMNDFGKFYYSTVFFLEGGDLYGPSPATLLPVSDSESHQFYNMNPPHFHLLVLPYSLWGPSIALAGWVSASVLSLAWSARITVRCLEPLKLTPGRIALSLLYLVAWVGTGSLLVTGQLSWLLLGPLAASWWAMRRGHWCRAGVLLGLLASVKPFFTLLLVYLVVRRQFRALLAGVLAIVLPFVVGIMVFGTAAHVSWIKSLGGVDWSWVAMNSSVFGFLARVLSANPALASLASFHGLVYPLAMLVAAVGVAATVISVVRRPADVDRSFALLLVAALLFSPLGWVYYYWFLVPSLVALASRGMMKGQPALATVVAVASLWPVPMAFIGQPSPLATLTVGSIYFWGGLALWIILLRLRGGSNDVDGAIERDFPRFGA